MNKIRTVNHKYNGVMKGEVQKPNTEQKRKLESKKDKKTAAR